MNEKLEKQFYNKIVTKWDFKFTNKAGRNFRNRKLTFLNECLSGNKGICLDVGCATGYFTNHITNKKLKVIGVDMSEGMIKYARKKYPNLSFVVCKVQNLSVKFKDVDCIFLMGVFSDKNSQVVLRECSKVLKRNGKLVITVGNKNNFYLKFIHNLFHRIDPARVVGLNELEKQLKEYNFILTKRKVFHLVPYYTPDFFFPFVKNLENSIEKSVLGKNLGSIIGIEAIKNE
jgi:ubiquinone/menaquinone biosynthesis C-methylase UbiE